jgi:hypothetical protein
MERALAGGRPRSPLVAPTAAVLAICVAWAAHRAGFSTGQWAPGALMVLALLLIGLARHQLRPADAPAAVGIALVGLALYTALSFLSILWAASPADAFEGANRTLLYLLVFALFALTTQDGRSATLLLAGWSIAMIVLAAYVGLRLGSSSDGTLQSYFSEGRLIFPADYANGDAAQWLMALWPAVVMARERSVPAGVRGLLAGGSVLLATMAMLSESRGSLFATAGMVLVVLALLRGRLRTTTTLLAVSAGVALAAPAVLSVGEHLHAGLVAPREVRSAIAASILAACAVGLLFAGGAAVQSSGRLAWRPPATVRRALGALCLAAALAGGGWVAIAAGDPGSQLQEAWRSFQRGYQGDSHTGSRLTQGLGSNRYDIYRVAVDEFLAHPIVGIGADNFQSAYLRHRHSNASPRYPHSVELGTLTETGLLGGAIGLVGLCAALLAAARAASSAAEPLAQAAAGAALAGFLYWLLHGSVDWFWEIAGLGVPAFALLGLACSLAGANPDRMREAAPTGPVGTGIRASIATSRSRRLVRVAAAALAFGAVTSLAAQWLGACPRC